MANYEFTNKTFCALGEPQSPKTPNAPNPRANTQIVGNTTSKDSHAVIPKKTPTNNTFDDLFGPKKFTRFYTIEAKNNRADLTKLNMFKVDRAIRAQIGVCNKISEDFHNGNWTVEVISKEQGEKLRSMTKLLEEDVNVIPHEYHNQSMGVVTCSLLRNYTEEDITEGLSDQGITKCRRIIKRAKSDNPEPTSTLILTFNTSTPPDRITIRTGLTERVRPYIPLPRRCFKCQKYGHSGHKCRKPIPVCSRCSTDITEDHTEDNCQLPVNCLHCNTEHRVSSRTCPRYLVEKEILAIKTKEHLTFSEAKAKVAFLFPNQATTYATATQSRTSQHQRGNDNKREANNNDNTRNPINYEYNLTRRNPDNNNNDPETNSNNISKKRMFRNESLSPERNLRDKRAKSQIVTKSPPLAYHSSITKSPPRAQPGRFQIQNGSETIDDLMPPHKNTIEHRKQIQTDKDIRNTIRKSYKEKRPVNNNSGNNKDTINKHKTQLKSKQQK